MKQHIVNAILRSLQRINNSFPIECESDFQSVFFGELYKGLPDSILRLEKKLKGDYQSYHEAGKPPKRKRQSRVDIHIIHDGTVIVVELKFLQSAAQSYKADMMADIGKVERILESGEAGLGYCVQLVAPKVAKKLPIGPIKTDIHSPAISGWSYNFEIKGAYTIDPTGDPEEYCYILHEIKIAEQSDSEGTPLRDAPDL